MLQVKFEPLGEFCISDAGRRDMLINLERYRASLERSRATLIEYNKSVK